MSTTIQSPVPAELLSHAFQLQGRQRLQLEDYIVPTIQVGNLDCGFAPAKCRSAMARIVQAAVAAEFAVFRLQADEGVLLEVVEIIAQPASTGALEIDLEQSITGATTEGTGKAFTDQRVELGGPGPGGQPAGRIFRGTQAGGISGEYGIPMTATGLVYRPADLIVGRAPFPASSSVGFFFETAVNELAVLSIQWREWYLV